jgi:hypothetical protein
MNAGTIITLLITLAFLYWLGSLAREYFTDHAERTRINKQPGPMLVAVLAAALFLIFLIGALIPAFGNLSVSVGDLKLRLWAIGLFGCFAVVGINYMTGRGR